MTIRSSIVTAACALLAASVPSPLPAQATAVDLDTVRAGRFDLGRMWTFEHAPGPYFSETYGFAADSAWFARARLAALRIPGCSASFVSPNGLIITNHHCARGGVTAVSQPGESLLDSGFVARSVDEERRVPDVQRQKLQLRTPYAAFSQLFSGAAGSAVLRRAWYHSRLAGASSESTAFYQAALRTVTDNPPGLEQRLLALQLADVAAAYGAGDRLTRAVLSGRSPQDVAAEVAGATPLIRAAGAANPPPGDDPAMRLVAALAPTMQAFQRDWERLSAAERELVADLGRARYAVYGSAIPPDGSGSPRIADGVVRGYAFNGTEAPYFTTIYGLYDRFVAHGPGSDWDLPYRWRRPPAGLDLGTPLNFVSTADTYGGNSGSPAVTKDLTLVGLNFDRNVEGLVRGYIFLPERGRNVMVDVRAVQAALDQVYDADRIVRELLTGRLFRTEQEADATTGR